MENRSVEHSSDEHQNTAVRDAERPVDGMFRFLDIFFVKVGPLSPDDTQHTQLFVSKMFETTFQTSY